MKKNLTIGLLLSLIIFTFSHALLMAEDPGVRGFSFLKISRGARNAAMGDAGVALLSGPYGSYFNPALGAISGCGAVGFMHQEYIFDTRREFVGAALPLLGGGLNIGFDYFKVSDIESREGPSELPTGYFDAQDILLYCGYAREVVDRLAVGVTGKYAAEKIESQTADAILVDMGITFKPHEIVTLGAAVRNVGSKPKFQQEEIELPTTFAAGVVVNSKLVLLAADLLLVSDDDTKVNLGAEHSLARFVTLRGGYKINYDNEDFTLGVGLADGIWQVDYAFVPFKSGLGSTHRFALTAHFR